MNNEELFYCNKGPLNLAHKHGRQAELKTFLKKFDEAILEHEKAKNYLIEALKLTNVTQAIQSLSLQLEYHKRQKDIVKLKKVQYEIRKKVSEHQLLRNRIDFQDNIMGTSSEDNSNEIQKAIFRTMEEADNLLDLLIINKNDIPSTGTSDVTDFPSPSSSSTIPMKTNIPPPATSSKLPKTDKNVIEELHTINIQLKKLIKQLMNELNEKDKQINQLKSRLKIYEGSNWESQESVFDPK